MLRINCIKRVKIIGTQYLYYDYFYYKKVLFVVCEDNEDVSLVFVNAIELVQDFAKYITLLSNLNNPILIIQNKKRLKRFGISLDSKSLSYALSMPVLVSKAQILKTLHATSTISKIVVSKQVDLKELFDSTIIVRK